MRRQEQQDPVTFEIIRHKLWQINDEAGQTIRLVSGSPIATEAYDFNTAILDAGGELLYVGPYVILQAAVQEPIIKFILREYRENPGICPGDMFICSDPFYGALHQNDLTCVAPVFLDDEIIAWSGCTIHQVDVGGPVPGGYAVGATNIYEEPPVIPPVKLVERGIVRKDLEIDYLRRSRESHLMGLDLRAMIAANNVSKKRITELANEFGVATLKNTASSLLDYAETRFRARLREIPDGTWRHVTFLDHDGLENRIYPGVLAMTKEHDRLSFDFNGTSAQAPALINCAESGLRGGVINAVLPLICFDIPWAAGGIWRAIDIDCPSGTIYNATWPAGVCMGSVEGARSVLNLASVCIGKMLAATEDYRDCAMASWCVPGAQVIFGSDQRGEPFGTMLLDSMAGGGAASAVADGLDSGSYLSSMDKIIPNVELNEYLFPILYLYRKVATDSGGPGRFKGGEGGEYAFVPYDTSRPLMSVFFSHGVEQPESVGICGGYPASTNQWVIVRNSDALEFLRRCCDVSWKELRGSVEAVAAKGKTALNSNDVMVAMYSGGGGWGDPFDRPAGQVLHDVSNGSVSVHMAEECYGVVVDAAGNLNGDATEAKRASLRGNDGKNGSVRQDCASLERGMRFADLLMICAEPDRPPVIVCMRCNHRFCGLDDNYKAHAAIRKRPLASVSYLANPHNTSGRFELREFSCPECGSLLDVEVALSDMPIVWDIQIRPNGRIKESRHV
jgi:N-methylhydantoinase B